MINTLPQMTGWSPEKQQAAQEAQAQSQQDWQTNQRARLQKLQGPMGNAFGIQKRINALPAPAPAPAPAAPAPGAPAPAQAPAQPGQGALPGRRMGWQNRVAGQSPEQRQQFFARHPKIAGNVAAQAPLPNINTPQPMTPVAPKMRSAMAEAGINGLQQKQLAQPNQAPTQEPIY